MSREARRSLAAALGLALLTMAVFAPAGRFAFIPYDDDVYVTDNPLVRDGLSWRAAVRAFTTLDPRAANWVPLTWLSHMADVSLFGLRPGAHHLVSILLHAAAAALLALVLRGMTGRAGPSLLVAALFALHPLRVESVAWVAERKDVLAAFFWMLALAAWLAYARRPGIGRYLAACAAVLLALLAKPMAVTLPLVLLLLDFWPLGRWCGGGARRLLVEKVPLLLLAAGTALLAFAAQRQAATLTLMELHHAPVRAANAVLSCAKYLGMMLWPSGLSPFYTYREVSPLSWSFALSVLVLAGATAAAALARRRRPWIAVGWCWYLVAVLPVIGIVQVGEQPLADRYTYLPSVGLLLGAGWSAAEPFRRREGRWIGSHAAALVLAVVACAALAAATRAQLAHWRDGEALFAWARRVAPEHRLLQELAEYNLGVAAAREGRLAEAERRFLAAVRARPGHADAWNNLGGIRVLLGRLEEGERDLRQALRLAPADAKAHGNLGFALARQGRLEEAGREFAVALAASPGDSIIRFQYGDLLQRLGRRDEAAASYREALRLNPANEQARQRLLEMGPDASGAVR